MKLRLWSDLSPIQDRYIVIMGAPNKTSSLSVLNGIYVYINFLIFREIHCNPFLQTVLRPCLFFYKHISSTFLRNSSISSFFAWFDKIRKLRCSPGSNSCVTTTCEGNSMSSWNSSPAAAQNAGCH